MNVSLIMYGVISLIIEVVICLKVEVEQSGSVKNGDTVVLKRLLPPGFFQSVNVPREVNERLLQQLGSDGDGIATLRITGRLRWWRWR